jgi:2-oxoglutarate ferredoxin oxidoreductase subunit alpha
MKINILLGGEAGQGVNEIATIIGEIFVEEGFFVFNYRDYPSLITGGHNFNILSVSDEKINSHDNELDIVVALKDNVIDLHSHELKKNCVIIGKGNIIDADKIIQENNLNKKTRNILFASALLKLLGIEIELLIDKLKEKFKGKEILEDDIKAAQLGFNSVSEKITLLPKTKKKKLSFMSGTEGIVLGAINSGIDIYLAYPMTPATPVLHGLASKQMEKNFLVFQPENEIAVINAALGASFTGARVMVGTSGGGFDLMTEAMSMQGMSEIPLVVYLAQRPGPGTGIPTYTMQADLNAALYSAHGEFPRVVIASGDALECIEKTNEAFYLAEKYRTLSIILADKHVAESYYTFTEKAKLIKIPKKIGRSSGIFKNYEITRDGNSLRSVPGMSIVKSTSYEHDEYGFTTEDAALAKKMFDKRLRKWESIEKEVRKFEMFKLHGKSDSRNLVIGWGSTKGAILDSISNLDIKFLQILYLKPFPDEIISEIKKAEKIIVVENNATGLLAQLITQRTGFVIEKHNRILKYDSRPFTPNELRKILLKKLQLK